VTHAPRRGPRETEGISLVPDHASVHVVIVNKLGLHARPAMAFAETAGKYIARGSQSIDGKSVMEIMLLAATAGTQLEITASGADAEHCVAELRELVERGFDEDEG
jgi:phosphotransferase system HPr (HPr) family protein